MKKHAIHPIFPPYFNILHGCGCPWDSSRNTSKRLVNRHVRWKPLGIVTPFCDTRSYCHSDAHDNVERFLVTKSRRLSKCGLEVLRSATLSKYYLKIGIMFPLSLTAYSDAWVTVLVIHLFDWLYEKKLLLFFNSWGSTVVYLLKENRISDIRTMSQPVVRLLVSRTSPSQTSICSHAHDDCQQPTNYYAMLWYRRLLILSCLASIRCVFHCQSNNSCGTNWFKNIWTWDMPFHLVHMQNVKNVLSHIPWRNR